MKNKRFVSLLRFIIIAFITIYILNECNDSDKSETETVKSDTTEIVKQNP
jgi:hypothetical protein